MQCEVCGKEYKRMYSHVIKHEEYWLQEKEKIFLGFFNEDYKHAFLNHRRIIEIWKEKYSLEEIKERGMKIAYKKSSIKQKGKNLSLEHKKNISKSLLGRTKEQYEYLRKMGEKNSIIQSQLNHYSRGKKGIRKDLGFYCNSGWEANIYRVFQYHGYKDGVDYKREFENIFPIYYDGGWHNYRIDLCDVVGLFGIKNAYIEIKGFMDKKSRKKINAFKEQYKQHTLLVIGNRHKNPLYDYEYDFIYNELEEKYKPLIPLWETSEQNLRNRLDLYAM